MLGGASALGDVGCRYLAMHLDCARGRPARLRGRQVGLVLCGGSVMNVVNKLLASVFVDVGQDEDNTVEWR